MERQGTSCNQDKFQRLIPNSGKKNKKWERRNTTRGKKMKNKRRKMRKYGQGEKQELKVLSKWSFCFWSYRKCIRGENPFSNLIIHLFKKKNCLKKCVLKHLDKLSLAKINGSKVLNKVKNQSKLLQKYASFIPRPYKYLKCFLLCES